MPERTYTQEEVEQILAEGIAEARDADRPPGGKPAGSGVRSGLKGEILDGLIREFADHHLKYTKDAEGARQLSELLKKTWGFFTEEYTLGNWDQKDLAKLPIALENLALTMTMNMPSMENRYLEIRERYKLAGVTKAPMKFTPETVLFLENLRQLALVRASRGRNAHFVEHALDAYSHQEIKETPQQVQRGIMDKVFGRH